MRQFFSKVFPVGTVKFAALIFSLLLVTHQPTFAFDVCQNYGTESVAQQNANVENSCGFSGLRWHTDGRAHETFCKIFGASVAQEELQGRQVLLEPCLTVEEAEEAVDEDADALPEAQDEQVAAMCLKSDIAEGKGQTTQAARSAAQDKLGLPRAELMNQGYNKCLFNDLGCTGGNGARTCYLSVNCCKQ